MADNRYKSPSADSSANRPAASQPPRRNEPRPGRPVPEAAPARAEPRPAAANVPKAARPAVPPRPARAPRGPLPGMSQALGLLRDRRFHLFFGFGLLLASLYLTIAFTS